MIRSCRRIDQDYIHLFVWFVFVLIILSMAGVVTLLSMMPKIPRFKVLGIANNYPSNNNSLVFLDFEVFNPNSRMEIYYSDINIGLYYKGGDLIGRNTTPGFVQGYRSMKTLEIPIQVQRWQEIYSDVNMMSKLIMVKVETWVRFKIIRWKTKLYHIEYEDEQLSDVALSLNGTTDYGESRNASKARIRN